MKRLIPIIIVIAQVTTAYSQQEILRGDWTSMGNLVDSITLYKGGYNFEDVKAYLNAPSEFDTIFCWHFKSDDIFEIEIVIRLSLINQLNNSNVYDSMNGRTESIELPKLIRVSSQDSNTGKWRIENDRILIRETKLFNGIYKFLLTKEQSILKLIKE